MPTIIVVMMAQIIIIITLMMVATVMESRNDALRRRITIEREHRRRGCVKAPGYRNRPRGRNSLPAEPLTAGHIPRGTASYADMYGA